MPDPFETLRWIAVGLYELFSNPEELVQLLRSIAIGIAFVLPMSSSLWGIRYYAKRHDREMPENMMQLVNSREPFADPRLNEPFELIRRSWPIATCALIAGGIVVGVLVSSMAVFYLACFLSTFVVASKRLFVEAGIAFGAEPSPAPEASTQTAT